VSDQLAVIPQYLMPKLAMTRLAGRVASAEWGTVTTWVIKRFVKRYNVNMSEAAHADPAHYKSFNEFFTRPLKEGVRPLASSTWVCPVDGAISQCGAIERDQIFQAKGHQYSTRALVGGDAASGCAISKWSICNALLKPAGLPPHSHAHCG
jgi:phosphatidylserine decarboxylase